MKTPLYGLFSSHSPTPHLPIRALKTTMKTQLYGLLVLLLALTACGCPKHPEIDPAAEANCPDAAAPEHPDVSGALLEGVTELEVEGIKVIVKTVPGNPVISAGLYIQGGSLNLSPENMGIESFALDMVAAGGATDLPREEMLRQLESMGSAISANAGRTYSTLSLRTLQRDWDASFEIFSKVVLSPAFPEDELGRQRVQNMQFLMGLTDSPDRYVSVLAQEALYEDHPYANRQWGTVENFQSFTADHLRDYYTQLMTRERLLFVVVGDVQAADVEAKVKASFAHLPKGQWTPQEWPALPKDGTEVNVFERPEIPNAYLIALFHAPPPGHEDFYPMVVATSILSSRLFEKVRTKLDLSYAVSSSMLNLPANYGYLYVTSSAPSQALGQIYDEVESMKDWLVNASALEQEVAVYLTEYYSALQGMNAQQGLLADAQLTYGDWRESANFMDRVRAVTPDDVRRVIKTYIKDLQIGYYGDPAKLDPIFQKANPEDADELLYQEKGLGHPLQEESEGVGE